MSVALTIVTPKSSDTLAIVRLRQKVWMDTYSSPENNITLADITNHTDDWLDAERIKDMVEKINLDYPDRFWRIAKQSDTVIGLIIGFRKTKKGYIRSLYVDPDYQGSGLGTKLVESAEAWLGNIPIHLEVVTYNHKAITFYKKLGFVETSIPPRDPIILKSGKRIPEMTMMRSTTSK